MTVKMAAKKAAKKVGSRSVPLRDGGENIALMEPLLIAESSPRRGKVADRALELAQKAAAFRASLPAGLVLPLADLVRSMNCYYSNLIEGHDTHPVDIERALNDDFSGDAKKRDLQLEAKAHIAVQRWIDEGHLDGHELTNEGLCQIHREFASRLPEDLLWIDGPKSGQRLRIEPGQPRTDDAQVGRGRHIAVSPGAIPRFMRRFEEVYSPLGKLERIISAGPAHHRLLWIHPFADGNGRTTRLMSYAVLRRALDTGGLWSVSRGLARRGDDYKRHLAECDLARRNDHDGRGNLSEEAMIAFALFFLEICIDQVVFMEQLMQPGALRERILRWAEESIRLDDLPAQAPRVLDAMLFKGHVTRSEVAGIIGQSERSARNVMTALHGHGIIASSGPRADWRIAFPAKPAPRLMPGLFP